MSLRDDALSCFAPKPPPGTALRAPLLLDLTLWHKWHRRRSTLPQGWEDLSEAATATRLGAVAWTVVKPWDVTYAGIGYAIQEDAGQRVIAYDTPSGTLTARWTLGPDGDWWQTEYPVKGPDDLPAARAVMAARTFTWQETLAASVFAEARAAGSAIVALELPMRPYSDLLHTTLGWGEGLMLFAGEQAPLLQEVLAILEAQAEEATRRLATMPGDLLLAPDNLDGQYISPRGFRAYLADSYRRAAALADAAGKPLMVHAGGLVRRLLPLLVECGVDAVEGIGPAPQSDATLAEARATSGPEFILWGGIPQDLLLDIHPRADFEAAVRRAAQDAAGDPRALLGVADRVSVDSDFARLRAIAEILNTL